MASDTKKPLVIPTPEKEAGYYEGYVNGIYDALCCVSAVVLIMCGVYWIAGLKP